MMIRREQSSDAHPPFVARGQSSHGEGPAERYRCRNRAPAGIVSTWAALSHRLRRSAKATSRCGHCFSWTEDRCLCRRLLLARLPGTWYVAQAKRRILAPKNRSKPGAGCRYECTLTRCRLDRAPFLATRITFRRSDRHSSFSRIGQGKISHVDARRYNH